MPLLPAHRLILFTSGCFFSPKITSVNPSSTTDFASRCAFCTCGQVASITGNPRVSASSYTSGPTPWDRMITVPSSTSLNSLMAYTPLSSSRPTT